MCILCIVADGALCQTKDASEPKIESWVKVHKVDRASFLEEVKKADWREDLKHTAPVRASTLYTPHTQRFPVLPTI